MRLSIIILLFVSITSFCQGLEEIEKYRPTFELAVVDLYEEEVIDSTLLLSDSALATLMITDSVRSKIKATSTRFKETGYEHRGWRIQVFSTNNYETASIVKDSLINYIEKNYTGFHRPKVYNKFDSPNFRIKVGNYVDKYRARSLLEFLRRKEEFEDALLVPDIIDLREIE